MPTDTDNQGILRIARLILAAAVVWVVFPAIDMPTGYMGARDEMTLFGVIYSLSLALAVLFIVYREWWGTGTSSPFAAVIYSINIGIFVPAIASDPTLAALVILWQLVTLAAELFDPDYTRIPTTREPPDGALESSSARIRRWYRTYGGAVRHLLVGATVLTLVVVGYGVSERWSAILICSVVQVAAITSIAPFLLEEWRQRRPVTAVALLPFVVVPFIELSISALLVAGAVSAPILLAVLTARSPLFQELLEYFYNFPSLLVLATFAAVISFGVLLLTLPQATPGPGSISALDALFTSTSATCVTGLIVLDTPHAFTPFGHGVIIGLIQVGGLGIMVVSTFAAVVLGRRLGLGGEKALGNILDVEGRQRIYNLVRFIVLTTVAVEAIGAALLSYGYWQRGRELITAIGHGWFHAISAFCNAGFALQSDSIVQFQESPLMVLTHAGLIVVGGLGFVVLATLWSWFRGSDRADFGFHTRVVLWMTGTLLALGAVLYGAFEWHATLGGLSTGDRILNTIFQSVTLRTAGFNSVAFGELNSSTIMVMMTWMLIGAAPGSTGGGVKVTTVAILLGAVRSFVSDNRDMVMFNRRIPNDVVFQSAALVTLGGFAVVVGCTALFALEPLGFRAALFETVSAFGTVGLSIGATGQIEAGGKVVIIALMFLGRTGPLSLALLLGKSDAPDFDYPDGRIMVG